MPRLFLTGVFFFIMMYMGSNVMPIANFLQATHLYQAFRSEQDSSRSVLGTMLPRAMVCYLENYGESVFVSVLGGQVTPARYGSRRQQVCVGVFGRV